VKWNESEKKNSIFTESEMKAKYKFEISAKSQWKWNEKEKIFCTFSIPNLYLKI
jgi:hypothetical protein